MDSDLFILMGAVLATFVSVLAVALPLVQRAEKRERAKAVIQQRRKDLFANIGNDVKVIKKDEETALSARDSMAALFRFQKLAGEDSNLRALMQQAGYRSPKAPIYYLLSRILLPLFLCGFAALILWKMEEPPHDFVMFAVMIGAALFGFLVPRILVKNTAMKRQQEISLTFPDALDMMLICVQGGISIEPAINRVAEAVADMSEILAEELGLLSAELSLLNDRRAAFRGFATRVGSSAARTFVNAMLQAEKYGASVSQAMRVIAEELRDMRMGEAERKAASLPPKLTVPMILFFLPTLFVVILAPAILSAMAL